MKIEIVLALVSVGSIYLAAGALTYKIFFGGNKTESLVTVALNDNLASLKDILNELSYNSNTTMVKIDIQHKSLKELHLINHDQTMDLNLIKDSSNALHRRLDGFKDRQQEHMLNTKHNHRELMKKEK